MQPLPSVLRAPAIQADEAGRNTEATQSQGQRPRFSQRLRGNVCWPGWVSALAVVMFVLLSAGCQSSEPVVPRDIYEKVNSDGREWTYDTAWQNIRRLKADLERGEFDTITDDALFVVSQMERLEKAKATAMTGSATAKLIEEVGNKAATRSAEANLTAAKAAAQRLQHAFDAGDFTSAKHAALEVYTVSRQLNTNT